MNKKDANENQGEEKSTPCEIQMKTSEKKKWHHAKRTAQRKIVEGSKVEAQ